MRVARQNGSAYIGNGLRVCKAVDNPGSEYSDGFEGLFVDFADGRRETVSCLECAQTPTGAIFDACHGHIRTYGATGIAAACSADGRRGLALYRGNWPRSLCP